MRKRSYGEQGFTLVEVMITSGIIATLAAICIPSYAKYHETATREMCIKNLTEIESMKQTWALESGKKDGDEPTEDELFGPAGYIRRKPPCPAGGDYTINAVGVNAKCTTPLHTL